MRVVDFSDNLKSEITIALKNKRLIPFLGSGFTTGESIKNSTNKVPNIEKLKELMIDEICDVKISFNKEQLRKRDLTGVSELFFKYVNPETYKKMISKNFINVILSEDKKEFLDINWSFIYTLNIDDAIEKNSDFTPVLPYKRLNSESRNDLKLIYKLHGCAQEEIKYNEDKKIIFSNTQYLQSLSENASMLEILASDLQDNHVIFIGCGLQNELDLRSIFSKKKTIEALPSVQRTYVTRSTPDELRQEDLSLFGINTIIVVRSYSDFYRTLYQWHKEISYEQLGCFVHNKSEKILVIDKDIERNKNILLDIAGNSRNELALPFFFISRDLKKDIINNYKKEVFSVVVGKRFSGKTIFAKDIARSIIELESFFFSSNTKIESSDISELMNTKDSVFIFDSSSIEFEDLKLVSKQESKLKENNIKIILIINKSDNLMTALAHGYLHKFSCSCHP